MKNQRIKIRAPHKILGVSRDASDEEIKKAYREQMKKYHPDNFSQFNVPEMDELANEKARELKDAYEAIIKREVLEILVDI